MSQPTLGRLERVSLREAWLSEASDFTPWLALDDNVKLLGEAIGLELEVEAQEKSVGPFRADLLCRSVPDGSWVLIENQLDRTDHGHLGQLLTYAAGLEAVAIVWIAERFTEEHRAALDWLNQITDRRFNFFGLEIELWRIGDSPCAPKFNVVSKPNDWSKSVGEAKSAAAAETLTKTKQLQLEYWRAFQQYLAAERTFLSGSSPQAAMLFALGRSGFSLAAVASTFDPIAARWREGGIRAQINIEGPNAPAFFDTLQRRRSEFEDQVGEDLFWIASEGFLRRKILMQRDADLENRADWRSQHEWLREKPETLHRVFAPAIRVLESPIESAADTQPSG